LIIFGTTIQLLYVCKIFNLFVF